MLFGLKPVETTRRFCFVLGTNVSWGLKTDEFCITQFPPPPFSRLSRKMQAQMHVSVSRGQALSSNSVELVSSSNSSSILFYKFIL